MGSTEATAFGRYLHELRERRGLILQEVEDRALAAGHRIDKGTVSRFERGQQRVSVTALLALGRIYAVPFEALLERLELDHDAEPLQRSEDGDTEYEDLSHRGRHALFQHSRKLEAYACFRDAQDALRAGRAHSAHEASEKARAWLNLATVARSLGKNRYALHELTELRSSTLPEGLESIVLDRLGNCYRCLGHPSRAERCLEEAVAAATSADDLGVMAYAYYSWAALEHDQGAWDRSLELLERAHRVHRESAGSSGAARPNPTFEVEVLLKMADVQLLRGAPDSSGGLALAARRLSIKRGYMAGVGYAELQLGEVHDRVGRDARAMEHWLRAVQLGRELGNRRLEFLAEFQRFRQLSRAGSHALARASRRSLERLVVSCPDHLAAVAEFRDSSNGRDRSASGNSHRLPRRGTSHPPEGETP
jgi:tetratricopeptide (TPR) repeat protein